MLYFSKIVPKYPIYMDFFEIISNDKVSNFAHEIQCNLLLL